MYGDTCTYYSSGSDDRCEVWGGTGAGEMGVADDNCCVCGGGTDAKTTASTAGGGGVRGGTTTKTMTAATTRPADIILATQVVTSSSLTQTELAGRDAAIAAMAFVATGSAVPG